MALEAQGGGDDAQTAEPLKHGRQASHDTRRVMGGIGLGNPREMVQTSAEVAVQATTASSPDMAQFGVSERQPAEPNLMLPGPSKA